MKILIATILASISIHSFAQSSSEGEKASMGTNDTISMFNGAGLDIYYIEIVKPLSIVASSTLEPSTAQYSKSNLVDGNKTTAWVEGAKDDGVGTELLFEFSNEGTWPQIIEFLPGYAKSAGVWAANNSIQSVEIFFLKEDRNPENAIISRKINFANAPLKWQFADFSGDMVQNMAMTEFKYILIRITQTYKGAKYNDSCISEITFKGEGKERAVINGNGEYYRVDK